MDMPARRRYVLLPHDEWVPSVRGEGGDGCPNRGNAAHTCTDWCVQTWGPTPATPTAAEVSVGEPERETVVNLDNAYLDEVVTSDEVATSDEIDIDRAASVKVAVDHKTLDEAGANQVAQTLAKESCKPAHAVSDAMDMAEDIATTVVAAASSEETQEGSSADAMDVAGDATDVVPATDSEETGESAQASMFVAGAENGDTGTPYPTVTAHGAVVPAVDHEYPAMDSAVLGATKAAISASNGTDQRNGNGSVQQAVSMPPDSGPSEIMAPISNATPHEAATAVQHSLV